MPSTTANRSPKSGSGDKSVVKQQLVQRLPYLRRYARALTGSQQIGDNYVRARGVDVSHHIHFPDVLPDFVRLVRAAG